MPIPQRSRALFSAGFVAGLLALAFNLLLRVEGLAAFPPEAAFEGFVSVVPASIEEPMVQQLGGMAALLGFLVATLLAAAVYGVFVILFDGLVGRLRRMTPSRFEALLLLSLVLWALYGLVLFPLAGALPFGSSVSSPSPAAWTFPLTFLLVQGVFALALSPRYKPEAPAAGGPATPVAGGWSRRDFIEKAAVGFLAAVAALVGLTNIGSIFPGTTQPSTGGSPIDLQDAPAIFSDPRLAALVGYEVTPNDSFYRVAIDIFDPMVNIGEWSLTVNGMVGSAKKYTLDEIKALPRTSQYTTLECVSNQINGDLISNAKWDGVKLSDLFGDAGGIQAGAKYVVFYSVDGYSVGVPVSKALSAESIVAYSMNGQPLPAKHGYPLRGLIPGLYGMMSAKWVRGISVIGSVYQGYWQTRGWTNDASVNTVAFVEMPESGSHVSVSKNGGSIILAGRAYAGDRGISKVEVSFDNGRTWQEAQLKKPLSSLAWALWAYEWRPVGAGEQFVYVRATDGDGHVQTSTVSGTFPDGATGYAYVAVNVAE